MNGRDRWSIGLLIALWATAGLAGEAPTPKPPKPSDELILLAKSLTNPLKLCRGEMPAFTVTVSGVYRPFKKEPQTAALTLTRLDSRQFALSVRWQGIEAHLVREAGETRLVVPARQVALVGKGPLPAKSALELEGVVHRLIAAEPKAARYLPMLRAADPATLALLLQKIAQFKQVPPKPGEQAPPVFAVKRSQGGVITLQASPDGNSVSRITWKAVRQSLAIDIQIAEKPSMPPASTEGLTVVSVPRPELEKALGHGLARAVEILYNQHEKARWKERIQKADGGRLILLKRCRIACLQGKPYAIGLQHGKLLAKGVRRFCRSTLYVLGIYYSVESKTWFPDTLRKRWKRLERHMPAEYLEELRGLADGSGIPLEAIQLANITPLPLKSADFALLPKATETKKVYHGQVLDCTVDLGLKHDPVLFIVKKDGGIPFASAGYAGRIGSIAGINARKVCLTVTAAGEDKGDGIPAHFIVRAALERAATLANALRILQQARRTGEHFYVVSDGKTNDAAGARATADKLEVIKPGQAHPALPTPVDHCVLVASGESYKILVKRAKDFLGKFHARELRWAMRPPVASTEACLRAVLCHPAQLEIEVAGTRGDEPAYIERFIRHELTEFFGGPQKKPAP